MSIKAKRVWLLVNWIVLLVEGIALCCTLVGLPLGIPAIIASKKFRAMRNTESDSELAGKIVAKENFGWAIFSWFGAGIVGILTFVFVYCMQTNDVEPAPVVETAPAEEIKTEEVSE